MDKKRKLIRNERTLVTHTATDEYASVGGLTFKTACGLTVLAVNGYSVVDGVNDCIKCEHVLNKKVPKANLTERHSIILVDNENSASLFEDEEDLLDHLRADHCDDESILEDIGDGGIRVYRAVELEMLPTVKTIKEITSLELKTLQLPSVDRGQYGK